MRQRVLGRSHWYWWRLTVAPRPSNAFHITGAIFTAVGVGAGLVASFLVAITNSIACGESEAASSTTWHLRLGLLAITVAVTAAPAVVTALARSRDRAWKPWAAIAGGLFSLGLLIAISATPGHSFCF